MPRHVYLPGESPPGKPVFFVSWESVEKFVRVQTAVGPDEEIEIAVTREGFDIYKVPGHTTDSE